MPTVTVRPSARRAAAEPPARSIWQSSQPPKMSPCALVSAGIAMARSAGSDCGGVSIAADDFAEGLVDLVIAAESLAEGSVGYELVSAPNSLLTGKSTGKFQIFSNFWLSSSPFSRDLKRLRGIPVLQSRDFRRRTGNFGSGQGGRDMVLSAENPRPLSLKSSYFPRVIFCDFTHFSIRPRSMMISGNGYRGIDSGSTMAEDVKQKRFTAEQALQKSKECRDLARRVLKPEHRTELAKIAEAWEELSRSLTDG